MQELTEPRRVTHHEILQHRIADKHGARAGVFVSARHGQLTALNGFQHVKGTQQFAAIITGQVEGAALAFRGDCQRETAALGQARADICLLRDTQGIDPELCLQR